MTTQDIPATLEKLGKAQTAAIYKRHGSGDNVFGVLTSELAKLQTKIKVDQSLAKELCRNRSPSSGRLRPTGLKSRRCCSAWNEAADLLPRAEDRSAAPRFNVVLGWPGILKCFTDLRGAGTRSTR